MKHAIKDTLDEHFDKISILSWDRYIFRSLSRKIHCLNMNYYY